MSTRRKGREYALQILYDLEASLTENDQIIACISDETSEEIIEKFFNHFESTKKAAPYTCALVKGILKNSTKIDAIIKGNCKNWRLNRLSRVDRNVLRIAIYELLFDLELSTSIIINEAIEIARKFGAQNSAQFVNGVLDSAAKETRQAK